MSDRMASEIGAIADPCGLARGTAQTIADLGVLGAISLDHVADLVQVELRPTAPACLFVMYFEQEIRRIVARHLPTADVSIRISHEDWVSPVFPPPAGQPWAR